LFSIAIAYFLLFFTSSAPVSLRVTRRERSSDLLSFTHLGDNTTCLKQATWSDGDIICCAGKLNALLPTNIASSSVTLQNRDVKGFDDIVMVVLQVGSLCVADVCRSMEAQFVIIIHHQRAPPHFLFLVEIL